MQKVLKIISLVLVLTVFGAMAMGSGSESSTGTSTTTSSSRNSATIEETILYDDNGIVITAKSLENSSIWGPQIKVLIENNTDKNVTVVAENVVVNGYCVNSSLYTEVAAGKKANDELTLDKTDLDLAGISDVANIEFRLRFNNPDNFETLFTSDIISLNTSVAEGFNYTFDDSGDVLYEGNNIKIVFKGISKNSIWGQSVLFYVENNSNKDLCVQVRDTSVNGFMVEPSCSTDVVAGKHAIGNITFFESEFKENEIETIEEIELSFHVFDWNSWSTIVDTAPITITVEE